MYLDEESFDRLHGLLFKAGVQAYSTTTFDRQGVTTIEAIVNRGQMTVGDLSYDEAVEQTRNETQQWALDAGAPDTFDGMPIIYRTSDCCENPESLDESHEIFLHGGIIAAYLTSVLRGKALRQSKGPLEEVIPFNADNYLHPIATRLKHSTDLEPWQFDGFIAEHKNALLEHVPDDHLASVELLIALRPAIPGEFKQLFTHALTRAREYLARIPNLQAIMDDFGDESDKPVDMDGFKVLSDAEAGIGEIFGPMLKQHALDIVRLALLARNDPENLGFEPDEDMFWG